MDAFKNKLIWMRGSAVASVVWFGLVLIASQINHEFRWFPYAYRNDYDFGPAGITALTGIAIIWAIGLGLPWMFSVEKS